MIKRLFARVGELAKKAWRFIWRHQTLDATVFATTLTATYWVMHFFMPRWLLMAVLGVTVIHEMAHYVIAKRAGVRTKMPWFMPLIYGVFGTTYVEKATTSPETGQSIALAGPIAGCASAVLLLIGAAYMSFMPAVYASGWIFLSQLWAGTFGSDGRKFRRMRLEAQISAPAVV